MKTLREQLLDDIEAYCAATGMATSTLCRLAVNDGKVVMRLREGKDITIGTLERLRAYMAANPPATDTDAPASTAPAASALTNEQGM